MFAFSKMITFSDSFTQFEFLSKAWKRVATWGFFVWVLFDVWIFGSILILKKNREKQEFGRQRFPLNKALTGLAHHPVAPYS